jgi:hypothetical protein
MMHLRTYRQAMIVIQAVATCRPFNLGAVKVLHRKVLPSTVNAICASRETHLHRASGALAASNPAQQVDGRLADALG